MKLRNILLILPFLRYTSIFCSHNEHYIDPIQAYLESNLVGNTPEQKQDLCNLAFYHVWTRLNCNTKSKQSILYQISQHAHNYRHDIDPELAECFFNALQPMLIERLAKDVIKLETETSSTHLTRSEKRTRNIAFCCNLFHRKLANPVDFKFDDPNFFSNKESYRDLLDQFQAGTIQSDK